MADESNATQADAAEPAAPEAVEVKAARFAELQDGNAEGNGAFSMDILSDVALPVTVELGRASMKISDLMALGPGAVVELDRGAGDTLNLLVRDVPFAKGEVVVIGNRYGLRITALAGAERSAEGGGGRA